MRDGGEARDSRYEGLRLALGCGADNAAPLCLVQMMQSDSIIAGTEHFSLLWGLTKDAHAALALGKPELWSLQSSLAPTQIAFFFF